MPSLSRRRLLAAGGAAVAAGLLWTPGQARAASVTLKLGSLAPEGSSWHKGLQKMAASFAEISAGEVELKVYAGGVAGNNIAAAGEENGDSRPQYKTVRHCPPAAASRRKVVAYDVEYRYRGDVYSSRLAFDPGDRLRVKVSVTPSE